jgi:UDP-GlcNAc:undecaprenyl-phosphate GlcNAc-1-phosphate transferase
MLKLAGQMAGAILVFSNGLRVETIAHIDLPWWLSFPITLFWLLLATNALNLIDGLDGLCTGIGLLATLTLSAAALIHGNAGLAQATLPLAGALLGFFCYNFNPATVFLGDSGALLLGFLLGCYGMIWTQKTEALLSVAVPLLALSIPLLDVSLSVVRRFLRNKPIFRADRGHIHHRLLNRGLSVRGAVLTLYLVGAVGAVFALLLSLPVLGRYQGLLIIAFFAAAWAGVRQLRYAEFDVMGGLLFKSAFRRTLERRDQIENLSSALEQSKTEDDWWKVLVVLARDLGWTRISWTGGQLPREQTFETASPSAWTFTIPVAGRGSVQVEGVSTPAGSTFDLVGFAEAVAQSCSVKRREWERLLIR